MTIAAKLQVKPGQRCLVVGQPDGVELDLEPAADAAGADAVLQFVRTAAELDAADDVAAAAAGDRLAWVAYPKAGQLGTDLNRDSLAAALAARGLRPVRQVSIDDTWSALRFRPGT